MLVFGFLGGIEGKFIQFVFGAILFSHVFCFAKEVGANSLDPELHMDGCV